LQRTNGHADQFGDLLSPLAALHQIFDLLDSLWRKLYLPHTSEDRDAKLRDLSHFRPQGVLAANWRTTALIV
jgi:hypothetical protein